MSKNKRNKEYFKTYCRVAHHLLSNEDINNPAIKSILRLTFREAINHASDLPGYDNKQGAHFVSAEAKEQISKRNLMNLVGEHIVPVSVIYESIINNLPFTIHELESELERFHKRAVITKDEDKKLKEAGLSKKMPENWDHIDPKARYDKVGINLLPKTYKEALNGI